MISAERPKVSILTTTYNHEAFIGQAVESVLAQETDFAYQMVVGEDCSTDRTREILLKYQAEHPSAIRPLLRPQNWGRRPNWIETFHACRGEYVAVLEGDDYWTDPQKLQLQADFLDAHPDCALCFHPVLKRFEDHSQLGRRFAPPSEKPTYTLADLLKRNFIATCSVMFRNSLFAEFPDWYDTIPAGDWPLHVLNAQHGDIGYINRVMAVHRIHSGGVWSPAATTKRLTAKIDTLETIKAHLGPEYAPLANAGLARMHLKMISSLFREQRLGDAAGYSARLLLGGAVDRMTLLKAVWTLTKKHLDNKRGLR